MNRDTLNQISKEDFPWVVVNENDSSDYNTFLCLPSAIREQEFLELKGGKYLIIPTETK